MTLTCWHTPKIWSRGGGQICKSLKLILKCSNAFNPVLYAGVVLGEMTALNNLDASPVRLASKILTGLSPDPSLLMVHSHCLQVIASDTGFSWTLKTVYE